MKKYIFGAALLFAVLITPLAPAQAATLPDAQIQAILGLLTSFGISANSDAYANVKAALYGIAPASTSATVPFCHDFNSNLTIGSSGEDISALNRALMLSHIEPSGNTFDEGHAIGVAIFQEKYASDILVPANLSRGSGYVGQRTRDKLNALYGCSNSQTNQNGQTMNVTGQTPAISNVNGKGGFGTGDSNNIYGQNFTNTAGVYLIPSNGSRISLTYSVINDGNIRVTVPNLSGGRYLLQVVNSTGGVSPIYDVGYLGPQTTATGARHLTIRYVSGIIKEVYTPGETFPLVIKGTEQTVQDNNPATPAEGFNVQVYLREANGSSNLQGVNATYNPQTAYWNAQLTAPTDTTKKYIVESFLYCSNRSLACGQRYSTADSMGQVGAAFGLNLSAAPTTTAAPTVTVISPNGGEVLQIGQTYTIRWSSTNLPASAPVEIVLKDTRYYGDTPQANSSIVQTTNTGSYSWTIPQNLNSYMSLGAGNVYKVWVRSTYGRSVGAYEAGSISNFSIVPPTTSTTAPTITANGSIIANGGTITIPTSNSVTLGWNSNVVGTTSCTLNGAAIGGTKVVGTSGAMTISSTNAGSYTYACTGMNPFYFSVVAAAAPVTTTTATVPLSNGTITSNNVPIANNGTITIPANTSTTLGWNSNVAGTTSCTLTSDAIGGIKNAGTSGAMTITGANAGSYTYACTGMNPFYFSVVAAAAPTSNATVTADGSTVGNGGTITVPSGSSVTLWWNSNAGTSSSCSLASSVAGARTVPYSGSTPLTTANVGSYTFACTGMNTFYFSVAAGAAPTPAPAATLDQPSQSATVAQPTISGTATVAEVFVNIGMYNNPAVTGTGRLRVSGGRWSGALIAPLNTGSYDVKVYDAATNSLLTTGSLSVAVNTSATISIGVTGTTLYWSASANATSCSYRVNGSPWASLSPLTGTSPLAGIGLIVGTAYTLDAFCLNSSGQQGPTATLVYTPTVAVASAGKQTASALDALNSAIGVNTSGTTSGFHYVWSRNLGVGSSYAFDILALQIALTREGVYQEDVITGGFYGQTLEAVKAFQRKYGIDETGFVGSQTRAKLNALYSK